MEQSLGSTDNKNRSPFHLVFESFGQEVPIGFTDQFLHSPDDPYEVQLNGTLTEVWHLPVLHPLFWALGQIGILVPYRGSDIPCTLEVIPGFFSDGSMYQEWHRTLAFERAVQFNTTLIEHDGPHLVGDLVGPGDIVYIVWEARFHPPSEFTLSSAAGGFRIGGRSFLLPSWLWPLVYGVVDFIQEADSQDPRLVRIDLKLRHPLFGSIFRYYGTFKVERTPKAAP